MFPATPADARQLIAALGASPHLIRHVELVGEAAELLLTRLGQLSIPLDVSFVRTAVILHDIGKVLHPAELGGPGSAHEPEGERMLIAGGVDPPLARVCLSHARWADMPCSLEELVVALADKLWKGVRVARLEERVIAMAADRANIDRWAISRIASRAG